MGLDILIYRKHEDGRTDAGRRVYRDGPTLVDAEDFILDHKEGGIWIDGSCFAPQGGCASAGFAIAQLIRDAQGRKIKWKVYQEDLDHDEPQEAA